MRNNLSVVNVYNKKNKKSKIVTQLLYGESFKVIRKNNEWFKIKNDLDGYKGFVIKKEVLYGRSTFFCPKIQQCFNIKVDFFVPLIGLMIMMKFII